MYANEAPGEKFPPVEVEMMADRRILIAFGPMVSSVYPEYLTDPAILFCPSDSEDSLGDHVDENGNLTLIERIVGNGQEGVEAIDASYTYAVWMLDRMGPRYPRLPIGDYFGLISLLGLNPPDPSVTEGPAQFMEIFDDLVHSLKDPFLGNDPSAFAAVVDEDRSVTAPHGNGGRTTVHRLREGVERFLITDINNPAASAMAQSEIFVMWDNVSSKIEKFNHVPGGSNVMYMDGHVEFVKYPSEEPPVDRATASFMHVFDRQG